MPPFGVDLSNATFSKPESESAPAASGAAVSSDAAPSGTAFSEGEVSEQKGTALEAKGETTTPSVDLRKDYSKEELEKMLGIESQPVAQNNQKFDDNFGYDIATLLKDPTQFAKFAQIYPPQYVERAKQVLQANGVNPNQPTNQPAPKPNDPWSDPRIQKLLETADRFETMQKEQRIEAIGQKLDTSFDKLSAKYPDADKNVVNWYLQGLAHKGISLLDAKGNLQTQILEKLFKADHEARNKAYEAKYQAKVKAQKTMNAKSRDMGSGGSLASVGGSQPRTIKEATKQVLNDLRASN